MNPYFTLQDETAARLAARASLADVPMITEQKGDVVNRINQSLLKAGTLQNADAKSGVAILIHTPTAVGEGGTRSLTKQQVKVRVEIYVKPLINDGASGLQLAPLDVLWDVIQQLCSWNYGSLNTPPQLLNFDTLENTKQEIAYYADFAVPKTITITAT